jgi:hypothetical protein
VTNPRDAKSALLNFSTKNSPNGRTSICSVDGGKSSVREQRYMRRSNGGFYRDSLRATGMRLGSGIKRTST